MLILDFFSSGPIFTNTILLACGKTHKAAIIDAPLDASARLLQKSQALNLKIEMLLLTHSHWDHMAEAAFLKKKLGVPLHVHAADAPNLRQPGLDGLPLYHQIEGIEPDGLLNDGQQLELGELKIEVIHTPGHSPGSICFYLPLEGVLLSGDTLFKGGTGRTDFPSSQPKAMWHSLQRLAKLPPETRVIPGHGEETVIGDEF